MLPAEIDDRVRQNQKSHNRRDSNQCVGHGSSLPVPTLAAGREILEHLSRIQTTHNKMGALSHHVCQNGLSIPVDKGHLSEVNGAASPVSFSVRFLPV